MKIKSKYWLIISLLLFNYYFVNAQTQDTTKKILQPVHKNIIKFNPTPTLLYSNYNITFCYERILDHKKSLSLSAGYFVIPLLFDTIANRILITDDKRYGFNFALEYRYYLLNKNKNGIPDGLYLAPYLSYYGYKLKNNINFIDTATSSSGQMLGKFYMGSLGVELGYQFVFKGRYTLDLVLAGPSISYYGGSLNVTGELNIEDIKDINEGFYDKLIEKYPYMNDFVIDKTFIEEGKINVVALGYRYLIQFGVFF